MTQPGSQGQQGPQQMAQQGTQGQEGQQGQAAQQGEQAQQADSTQAATAASQAASDASSMSLSSQQQAGSEQSALEYLTGEGSAEEVQQDTLSIQDLLNAGGLGEEPPEEEVPPDKPDKGS